jgi:hypothetical protein
MAGGKGSTFDNDLLKLIFNGVAIANIADNAASAPLTNLYMSLHTADPGVGGSQTVSEAAYTGYTRMAVPRTTAGFTVSGNACTLAASVIFPTATGGTETEIWTAVGTNLTGAGKILYRGPITPSLAVSSGVSPQLTTGTTITES